MSPTQPLDYQLTSGVEPVGTPTIAEWSPSPEIFVRGSDDRIYGTHMDPFNTQMFGWADWEALAGDAGSDPAAVFSDATTVYLAFRSQQDATISLTARMNGNWVVPRSLGAPSVGAATAPAIAARDGNSLVIVVLGGDGLFYMMECSDARQLCAGSAGRPDAWMALDAPPPGSFVGAPSIVWLPADSTLMVAGVGQDRQAWVVSYGAGGWGNWTAVRTLDLAPDDSKPGVAINAMRSFDTMGFFARHRTGLLVNVGLNDSYPPLGGVLASVPAVVGNTQGTYRIDVAALIDDHGKLGVWWRFDDLRYHVPCNFNEPGTCAQCGCNVAGKPRCDL